MRFVGGEIEIKNKNRIYLCALWMLAQSGVCGGLPLQNKQAAPQENLTNQDSLSVQVIKADDVPVKAGEDFSFTFKFDRAAKFPEGGVVYEIINPHGDVTNRIWAPFALGAQECKATFHVPFAAPGGTWTVRAAEVSDGFSSRHIQSIPRTFQVIANEGIVLPTSADILANPSQQQLLRLEARHLQQRIEDLKAAIVVYQQAKQQGQVTQVLRTNIREAVNALDKTEAEFEGRATAQDQSSAAKTFFGDLRLDYETVALDLDHRSAGWDQQGQFLNVALSEKSKSDNSYPILAQAVLRAFEGNELAYNIVAETGYLTFDLKVASNPSGAVVTYHRRGDPPHQCPDATTAVIPSLPLAIWYVRVEKPGYKAQEREHDAIRSTDHVVNVELSP